MCSLTAANVTYKKMLLVTWLWYRVMKTKIFGPVSFQVDRQRKCNKWMTEMKQNRTGSWQQIKCDQQDSRNHMDHCLLIFPRFYKYVFLQQMQTLENYKYPLLWLWISAMNWIIYISEEWNGAKFFEHWRQTDVFYGRHFAKERCGKVKMCKQDTE